MSISVDEPHVSYQKDTKQFSLNKSDFDPKLHNLVDSVNKNYAEIQTGAFDRQYIYIDEPKVTYERDAKQNFLNKSSFNPEVHNLVDAVNENYAEIQTGAFARKYSLVKSQAAAKAETAQSEIEATKAELTEHKISIDKLEKSEKELRTALDDANARAESAVSNKVNDLTNELKTIKLQKQQADAKSKTAESTHAKLMSAHKQVLTNLNETQQKLVVCEEELYTAHHKAIGTPHQSSCMQFSQTQNDGDSCWAESSLVILFYPFRLRQLFYNTLFNILNDKKLNLEDNDKISKIPEIMNYIFHVQYQTDECFSGREIMKDFADQNEKDMAKKGAYRLRNIIKNFMTFTNKLEPPLCHTDEVDDIFNDILNNKISSDVVLIYLPKEFKGEVPLTHGNYTLQSMAVGMNEHKHIVAIVRCDSDTTQFILYTSDEVQNVAYPNASLRVTTNDLNYEHSVNTFVYIDTVLRPKNPNQEWTLIYTKN